MQSKNVLKLHKNQRNVVDLHDSRLTRSHKEGVVDLRSPIVSGKRESFESALHRKLRGEDVVRKQLVLHKRKIDLSKLISKSIAILLLVSFNSFAISQVGNTFSVLNDIEQSTDNYQIAGVIDFSLTLSPFSNNAWQNLVQGTTTDRDVDLTPNVVSNPFFYFASSTNFVGDDEFCEAINVLATLEGDVMYDGPLTDLLSPTTTNVSIWNVEFSNNDKFFNSVCQFDIDFNGWQTRHDYPKYHDGFSDTEKTTHILYSDGLKINKVYFESPKLMCRMDVDDHFLTDDDPRLDRRERGERQEGWEYWPHPDRECYRDRGREDSPRNSTTSDEFFASSTLNVPHYEWVEIYNPNDEPADIDGWFLCDGQQCDVLNAPESIPPFGFAIVVGEIGHLEGWITPSDFVIIVTDDGVIGDGLDNENDALFLKRPDNFSFDQVNWGIPNPLWPYYVPELWNPGVASTTEGTMMARIPTGFDTNQVTDFQILGIPQINLLYPGDVVDHKWYWDFNYLVTWESLNPNGLEDELLVDIWMIRDTNHNGEVDGEDEHIQLKDKIVNDGNENITVPEGFIGTIWIKIIATGPENPMAHGFDFSGPIYDPIPTFMLGEEDEEGIMQQAVIDQINATGDSEFAHILIDPGILHQREATSSTASPTNEQDVEEPVAYEEHATTTATTTNEVATTSLSLAEEFESSSTTATSTTDSASSTAEAIEPTFEEEITGLIEEFVEEHTPVEEASTSTPPVSEDSETITSTSTPAITQEEVVVEEENDE